MSISSIQAGRSAAERLTTRPDRQITMPVDPAVVDRLWARYVKLTGKAARTEKEDVELFELRQRLDISDVEGEVYADALRVEAELSGADDEVAACVAEIREAYQAREALQRQQHAAWLKMKEEMDGAKLRCQVAHGRHGNAAFRAQQLAGLRARFYRLFAGTRPGARDGCFLPVDLGNKIINLGIEARDMAACK